MAHEDIPILVVDDARFSNAILSKALRSGGFQNVRFTDNPLQALRSLEKRPAQILIADWMMPGMDGLELARRVRRLDESLQHFTYIILLTARDDFAAMRQAFDNGVDDFLNKNALQQQLLPRVIAAQRLASRYNNLLRTNRLLRKKLRELQTTDLVDPVTGLGNLKFTLDRLEDAVRHAEARGGAACLILVGISNLEDILDQHDRVSTNELMSAMAARLRHLVRPMDVVTRPDASLFAVVTLQPSIETCTSHSFKRLFDGLYMHAFKTSDGYIPVVVGVSISAADTTTGLPTPKAFIDLGNQGLRRSFATGLIHVEIYEQPEPGTAEAL